MIGDYHLRIVGDQVEIFSHYLRAGTRTFPIVAENRKDGIIALYLAGGKVYVGRTSKSSYAPAEFLVLRLLERKGPGGGAVAREVLTIPVRQRRAS